MNQLSMNEMKPRNEVKPYMNTCINDFEKFMNANAKWIVDRRQYHSASCNTVFGCSKDQDY